MNIFFNSLMGASGGIISTPSAPTATEINISTATPYAYSVYNVQSPYTFIRRSAFATLKVRTNAPQLTISYVSPLVDRIPSAAPDGAISVYDANWNFVTSITPIDSPNLQTETINLSGSGVREYYLVESGNTTGGVAEAPFDGTYITKINSIGGGVEVKPITQSTNRIVSIGDSISIGDGSTLNSRYGWAIRLRDAKRATGWGLTSDGWGAAYTLGIFSDNTKQQAGADRIVSEFSGATGRKVILWMLGTNDYGYVVGDPANVATAAASVWDKAYAADSGIEVIVVTPIIRSNESANSGGWTLQDYRDALTNAASTRAFVTAYDGKAIMTTTDLSDGVHPNNTGHQKMADYIQTIL